MRYYVKTFYRYGRVSAVEDKLMRFGEKKRQYVLSSEALDRFVQEIKEEQELERAMAHAVVEPPSDDYTSILQQE